MKKLFLFISIFVSCCFYGQKKYTFDYTYVLEEKCKEHPRGIQIFYLVNSKENKYNLFVHEKDSLFFDIHFIDNDGVAVHAKIKKEAFYRAETLVNSCTEVFRFSNPYKKKIKYLQYVNYNDTIINDTTYYHYALKSTKSFRYQKRRKLVTSHFIVAKTTTYFAPFSYHSTIYEKFKTVAAIPNGYPKIMYSINCFGQKVSETRLKQLLKTDTFLTIPKECDYTKEEIRNKLGTIMNSSGFY